MMISYAKHETFNLCMCPFHRMRNLLLGGGGDPKLSLQFEWDSSDNDFYIYVPMMN
jgi:hypothetical protein